MNGNEVFRWLDRLKVRLFGLDLAWWKHSKEMRKSVAVIVLGAFLIWIIQGYDSGITDYGTSLHWSVFVIYGLAFIELSGYYERELGVTGSQNTIYAFVFTVFSVALFEWYWMISYAFTHGKAFVLFNNLGHTFPNLILTVIGGLFLWHIRDETNLKLNPRYKIIILGLAPCLAWILMGFPQTSYPQLNTAPLYIENNWIHTVNLLAKIGFTVASMSPMQFTYARQRRIA